MNGGRERKCSPQSPKKSNTPTTGRCQATRVTAITKTAFLAPDGLKRGADRGVSKAPRPRRRDPVKEKHGRAPTRYRGRFRRPSGPEELKNESSFVKGARAGLRTGRSGEVLVTLLTITHPNLPTLIRICTDYLPGGAPTVSRGNSFSRLIARSPGSAADFRGGQQAPRTRTSRSRSTTPMADLREVA